MRDQAPAGRNVHDLGYAFTANMIDPRRYMVKWSNMLGCFIRWTWWFPTTSERI